jgi:hypothetical protein
VNDAAGIELGPDIGYSPSITSREYPHGLLHHPMVAAGGTVLNRPVQHANRAIRAFSVQVVVGASTYYSGHARAAF